MKKIHFSLLMLAIVVSLASCDHSNEPDQILQSIMVEKSTKQLHSAMCSAMYNNDVSILIDTLGKLGFEQDSIYQAIPITRVYYTNQELQSRVMIDYYVTTRVDSAEVFQFIYFKRFTDPVLAVDHHLQWSVLNRKNRMWNSFYGKLNNHKYRDYSKYLNAIHNDAENIKFAEEIGSDLTLQYRCGINFVWDDVYESYYKILPCMID